MKRRLPGMRAMMRSVGRTVCVLASVGIAVIWGRSASIADFVRYSTSNGTVWEIEAKNGKLFLSWEDTSDEPSPAALDHWSHKIPEVEYISITGPISMDAPTQRYQERVWRTPPWTAPSFLGFSFQNDPRTATFPGLPLAKSRASLKWLFPNSCWVRFGMPLWVFAALGLAPLAWWGVSWLRRKHAKTGLCTNCGYDLRATPNRCPECGTVPTQA